MDKNTINATKEQRTNPVLSIAVLVSNRRETIRQCLDSLAPVREAIPCELILVDTGCDEDLHALLLEYGDIVTGFTWCNDFSKARNESLRRASGEWFLYLDDDEWFVETKELIAFFASGEYKQYGQACYIQRNFLDMEATQYTDSWVNRMVRLQPSTHFESRIHEYLVPREGEAKWIRAIVHHFGYVYESEEALRAHYERNRVLLEEMIAEEPKNLRWRMLLLQEYRSVQESRLLYDCGEECLRLSEDINDPYDNITIGSFYGAMILALKEEKRYDPMLAVCLKANKDERMTQMCRAFTALRAADACFHLKQYAECERWAAEYLRWKKFFDENESLLNMQKAVAFVGECLDIVMIKEGYSMLICAGLKQRSTAYLQAHLDRLAWDEQHLYVYEEIMSTLIEAMSTMEREPIFERLLALMHGHTALWEYFCGQLIEYEQAGHRVTSVMNMIRDVVPEALMTEEEAAESGREADSGREANCRASDGCIFVETPIDAEKSQELLQLAAGIKKQLRLLIDNGVRKQAVQILTQVQKIFPEDDELLALERELIELQEDKP